MKWKPEAAVKRGAALLDKANPDWWKPRRKNSIKLTELDLSNCNLCVLGQLYANGEVGYFRGLRILRQLADEGKLRLPKTYLSYVVKRHGLTYDNRLVGDEFFGFDRKLGDYDWADLTRAWTAEIRSRRRAARAK